MRVDMNQAATSATKPQEVIEALTAYIREDSHRSAGRGGNELAAARTALESRMALAGFFGARSPRQVVFTSGATESLNMAMNGLIRDGCHVLATSLEHNAVARPLHHLEQQGRIKVTWLPCSRDGVFNPLSIHSAVRPTTRLLVMTHASNVLGSVLPAAEAFSVAKHYGLFTVLDAAQTAGHLPVRLDDNTDIIVFTGHKGLRGVAGIGGLILNETVSAHLDLWKAGGTGSMSQSLDMPPVLPDKFEPGTANTLGIISLAAAIRAIAAIGLDRIHRHDQELMDQFVTGLRRLPVPLYGRLDDRDRTPVVSLNVPGQDAGILARRLYEDYEIETRSGLHCAPLAHQTIGTFPQGTLRFSFGCDTSAEEIEYVLEALSRLTAG
ncbi:MAG: aminotransferase class V-fold PLP-dependent enzyme [Planctomycetes bacterium]|nr:aminotransferase class V-fold PLP-dependent enzyme [Planctomycetota bacterium]